MITATGWRWKDIDDLTLPQYEVLSKFWQTYPPVAITTQRIYSSITGYQPPTLESKSTPTEKAGTLQDFVGMFMSQNQGQGIVIEKKE